MDRNAQKIFNNSLLYSVGNVATKAVSFFLVPIYTNFMTKAEYGVGTTIASFVSMASIIVLLAMESALIRFYGECDIERKKKLAGTAVTFVSLNAVLAAVLLIALHPVYLPWLFKDIDFMPLVFMGILAIAFFSVYQIFQGLLRARQEGKLYSLNSIVYVLVHAAAVVLFVAVLKWNVFGLVLSNLVTNVLLSSYGVIFMARRGLLRFGIDRQLLSKLLRYSLPILPHDLFNSVDIYALKVIVNRFMSYAASGIYTLGSQFATIFNLIATSVNLAFRPWFVEQMDRGEEGKKLIRKMTVIIMALYSFFAVAIAVFSKEIVVIMSSSEFTEAWKVVPLFILAQLITFIYYSHVQSIFYNLKKSKFAMICSFASLLADVVLSILLVRHWDLYGILAAQIVSKIVLAVISVVIAYRSSDVRFGLREMILDIIVSSLFMAAGWYLSFRSPEDSLDLLTVGLKLLIIAAAFFVFFFRYRKDYASLLRGLFKRKGGASGNGS